MHIINFFRDVTYLLMLRLRHILNFDMSALIDTLEK